MQLTNTPGKLVLPFANAGAKNTIPTASQIGITAGAASLTDGFPPLTRTPIAAGGVPPSGLDMNGILYELSAILRWANAGGGYAYDAAFATDSNVGGYPKGARIMRSDGLGYWFNTVENNTTDPEVAGAAAAGWVPDFTNGVTAVTMTSANVTLTPLQYGKPIIVITGTLTANLNLIFPTIVNEWTVINNTTGPYTITCKTAAGTGLVVNTAALLVGDGTNIQSAITDAAAIFGETVATATGGAADAITATFAPVPRYASNGVPLSVRATAANATTTPTFTPNSGVIAAATIVKGNNLPLVAGDIAGAGHWLELAWDSTLSKWVLLNPAYGVVGVSTKLPRSYLAGLSTSTNAGAATTKIDIAPGVCRSDDDAADISIVATITKQLNAAWVAGNNGGLDTGSVVANTGYHIWAIYNPTTTASDVLFSTSVSAPTMPSGFTKKRRIGWIRTDGSSLIKPFFQRGDVFLWKTPGLDVNAASLAAGTGGTYALPVPSGLVVQAWVKVQSDGPDAGGYVHSPEMDAQYPAITPSGTPPLSFISYTTSSPEKAAGSILVPTDTAASIRVDSNSSWTETVYIGTLGWIDTRGRNN